MVKSIRLVIAVISAGFSTFSGAQNNLPTLGFETSADSISAQMEAAASVRKSSRKDAKDVRENLNRYLEDNGLKLGPQEIEGSRVNVMVEVVRASKDPGEKGFHTARRTAYQRAYLTAIGKFISQRAQVIENNLGSVFKDNSDNIKILKEICTPTRGEAVRAKLGQLAEAMVDSALKKLDSVPVTSPAQPAKFNCPAEEQLFRSVTTRRAAESLSGMRVVFSDEINAQVGIVLVHSSRFEDVARRLLSGQGARQVGQGDPLDELRNKLKTTWDVDVLRGTFGTRILTSSGGDPVVVTFSQADPDISPADSERTIDRKFDKARRIAYNEGAAELARFARVMAVFSSENTAVDETGRNVDLETGAYDEPAIIAEKILEKVETSSRLQVQGFVEVHSWEIEEDQNGQALVGVVLAWSPVLQSTFGRDAPRPGATNGRGLDNSGQHKARGAFMREDW